MLHGTAMEKNRCNWCLHAILAYYIYVQQMYQYSMQGVKSVHITVKKTFMAIETLPALLAFVRGTTSHWWIPDIANDWQYQTSHNYHKRSIDSNCFWHREGEVCFTNCTIKGRGTGIWMAFCKNAKLHCIHSRDYAVMREGISIFCLELLIANSEENC